MAAGMVGGLSLGYLQLSSDQQKTQKKIEAGFEIDMLTLEMAQTLSNDKACTETLAGISMTPDQDVSAIKNSNGSPIFQAGKKYGQNLIKLDSIKLDKIDINATDGFGSVELKLGFEKTANIIKGKRKEERVIPLAIQKTGSTVTCNPDPATRYLASDAQKMMCDALKGDWNPNATPPNKKCKPKFVDISCGTYITGFKDDGAPECETQYSF